MEARTIDISEWDYLGEGGSSTSYSNKKNGNLIVKLNNREFPADKAEKEYLASKAFNEAGFPSPKIYDFVTDGERFGYTSQRVKGKLSFARMLSQEPDSLESLAQRFAEMAHGLHRTRADVSKMSDARKSLLDAVGDLSFVPEDVAENVRKCFSSIGDESVCLHGDMNPGNLISFEGKDCWIGVNEFSYGDPYLDIATMHIICFFLPPARVKRLYHADQKTFKKFFKAFKKYYFGEKWNSKEVKNRIRKASIVKFCAEAATKPEYSRILIPLVRGRKVMFQIRRKF